MGNFEYVRNYYKVPAEYGRRVVVDGKPGIIIKDCGAQIGVAFDDGPAHIAAYCHPTWHVEYGDIGTPRKITASQLRYQEYLDADSDMKFGEWLKWRAKREAA